MANNISSITDGLIFFGNELLLFLQNSLVLASLVRNDYPGAATAPGAIVRVPTTGIVGGAAVRAIGGALNPSAVNGGYIDITVQQIAQAVAIDNLSTTFANTDLMTAYAKELAYNVASEADRQIAALWNQIPYEVGKADGSAAFNSTDDISVIANARKVLMQNKAPQDVLHGVFNPSEVFNLQTLNTYKSYQVAGDTAGLREGALKPLYGVMMHETQTIQSATVSTSAQWGTPAINNASGYSIGDSSIAVDGLGTGTIKAGSTFALGNYRYVVTTDATITTNAATLSIFPALKEAISDNASLTPTAHSAAGSQNLVFHPNAIIAVSRPAEAWMEGAGIASTVVTDPQTGLSLRLSLQSQLVGGAGTAMTNNLAVDFLFGCAVVRPELAVRVTGQV